MHLTSLVLIDCRMRSDLSMCFTSLLLEQCQRSEIIFIWKIHQITQLTLSGCYHLPAGPFSNDSIAMDELCAAMRTLGVIVDQEIVA